MSWKSIVALSCVVACSSREESRLPAPPPANQVGSNVAPMVPPPADAATAVQEHMRRHFAVIGALQRAIARGQLDDARSNARWIVEHDEPLAEGWKPFVDELKTAARAVERATDLPTAAALAARLGRACSRCHEAQNAIVTFPWEPTPEGDSTVALQLKRHQWAAARLWEGLVGPSDEMWSQGTSLLATTKLDSLAAARGVPRGDITALATKVHELATKAGTVTDQDARASLYGELLSTCAGCHSLIRPAPVDGP